MTPMSRDRRLDAEGAAALLATLEARFEAVRAEVETHVPGTVVDTGVEYIDGSDAGAGSWDDEGWQ